LLEVCSCAGIRSYDRGEHHVRRVKVLKMSSISLQIEILRQKLLETVEYYRGDFLHPNVLRISQELDLLIVRVQEERRLEQRSTGVQAGG
jgi:hypothetical protein